ncbi:unnamed protein product, partial [Phaeothamnion confervicola]
MNVSQKIQQWSWQIHARLHAGEALEWLFSKYSDALHRYALSLSGRRELAEDAVQEVFLRLSSDLKKLPAITHPQAYLYRAVRNQVLRENVCWAELPEADCIASDALSLADRTELLEALQKLPLEQREALFFKEVLQFNFREISEILDISLSTVASRHRYGLEKLRESLNPQ